MNVVDAGGNWKLEDFKRSFTQVEKMGKATRLYVMMVTMTATVNYSLGSMAPSPQSHSPLNFRSEKL